MSPTQRTLRWLREQGYTAAVVEHWNQYAHVRQDLFGFADVVALHPDHRGVLAVQCTTGANTGARTHKLGQLSPVELWIATGNRVWVVGWRQVGPRGKRKRWEPKVIDLSTPDGGRQ